MLALMRKHAKSWLIKVLFSIIIIVFAFYFGYGRLREKEEDLAAIVNDQKITVADYQRSLQELRNFYRAIYRDSYSETLLRDLNLEEVALDSLVNQTLLLQEADRLHLSVSGEELRSAIASEPTFQKDGAFSQELYNRVLGSLRVTSAEFEVARRQELLVSKLQDLLKTSAKVTGRELWETYTYQNEKVNLGFLTLTADALKESVSVSDSGIEKYFEENKERLRLPERMKIAYLTFRPEDFEEKAEVPYSEVEEYYELDLERYAIPSNVRARHILVACDPEAGQEEVEDARQSAQEIFKRLEEGGEDFAALAETHSDDFATAEKGGDLGFFKKGDMVPAFEKAAFSLKEGEISPPVRTPNGFHIIKVEEIREPTVRPLDEVKDSIISELKKEKAVEVTEQEVNRAYNAVYKAKSLDPYADTSPIEAHETNYFSPGEKIPELLGVSDAITSAAFSLSEGAISRIVKMPPSSYVIFQVMKKEDSRLPELEEVKDRIRDELTKKKAFEVAEKKGAEILSRLREGQPGPEVALKEGLTWKETGLFTRGGGFVPKIGKSQELEEAAFALSDDEPYPDLPFAIDDALYIIALKEKVEASPETFSSEKEALRGSIRQRKAEETFSSWLESVRKNSTITTVMSF
jgi:peptidyl-prolyl cis-trans isomerase D